MRRSRPGQALVETALLALVATTLTAGSLGVARVMLTAHRTQALAKFSAELAAFGVDSRTMEAEATAYASRLGLTHISVQTDRYTAHPAAGFYRLVGARATSVVSLPTALGGARTLASTAVVQEEPR